VGPHILGDRKQAVMRASTGSWGIHALYGLAFPVTRVLRRCAMEGGI
jgi:hypothetical protein